MKKTAILLILLLLAPCSVFAGKKREITFAPDSTSTNIFRMSADIMTRGEYRDGGVAGEEGGKDYAAFISGRVMLTLEYEHKWFSMRVTPRFSGVWGQGNNGTFSLFEGWFQAKSRQGLFAKIGRQELSYDDERIIGSDDWTMLASSHDVVKLGYDGKYHQVHAIVAYNQNLEKTIGGTFYIDGSQPYKTMQTVWYHFEVPQIPFGGSALFMNVGVQSGEPDNYKTLYQQLTGGYLCYHHEKYKAEASGYYQFGKHEEGLKLSAWMASGKFTCTPTDSWQFSLGYDYLSGDKYFAVPAKGALGLVRHTVIRGFSPLFGSHHEFYGAMDFFYLSDYVGGFTPGLQNAYATLRYKPIQQVSLLAEYHFFATGTDMSTYHRGLKMPLGHMAVAEVAWKFAEGGKLAAGYTYMNGTETMQRLKKTDKPLHLHWVWLSIRYAPKFLNIGW